MINLELFDQTISLLSAYKNATLLNDSQKHFVDEAISRLKRAKGQYPKIMELNNVLLKENTGLAEIRSFMSDEKLITVLQDSSKNDPELAKFLKKTGGKLILQKHMEGSSYDMSALDTQSNPQSEELKKLHLSAEEFYENLWLVIQKLTQVPLFNNYLPKGVRDVRNHLIVHTEKSGACIFSFGFTTSGPLIRPIKPTGVKAPNDNGFDPNILEFLNGIISKLN